MHIENIRFENFRNLPAQALSLEAGVHIFLGENGQGKTNFLEMIYFLGSLKSFRGARRRELMQKGKSGFTLEATLQSKDLQVDLAVTVNAQGRMVKINGNRVANLLDYFAKIRTVCFSPEDLTIIQGAPGERRRFIDRLAFQCRPKHLFMVTEFSRVLKQRNALLRRCQAGGQAQARELAVWHEQFLALATQLTQSRLELVAELNQILPQEYFRVCGKEEEGILQGQLQWFRIKKEERVEEPDATSVYRAYEKQLKELERQEKERGVSLWGPHLEDFLPFYGDSRADLYASMGQQKTLLLALRLTELKMVTQYFEDTPLLLLDDLSSELDQGRLQTLIEHLADEIAASKNSLQVLVTTVAPVLDVFKPLGRIHEWRAIAGEIKNTF